MSFVAIASPQSEPELSVMLCTLEAHDIPVFVQGHGFGSLYPGPQIASYNARQIMVSDSHADEARELLSCFAVPADNADSYSPTALNKLRVIVEVLMFGWFVPGNRRQGAALDASVSSREPEKAPGP